MSIILNQEKMGKYSGNTLRVANPKVDTLASYQPTGDEAKVRQLIIEDFRKAWTTMHYPRVEFNDLSIFQRYLTDMSSWNTYQQNDGRPALEDKLGGWRSNAVRPVVRNKAVTLAAHAVARNIRPKLFAYDSFNNIHDDSANAIDSLLTWFMDQADYNYQSVIRIIAAMYSPHSIGYTEYASMMTSRKDKKVNGKWTYKDVEDEENSGPKHLPIPCDQFFFPNFYEPNLQKQDFVILRRIRSYDECNTQYAGQKNWEYVKPGIQLVMDSANKGFYQVYDTHIQNDQVEEVIYWRKKGRNLCDVRIVLVNGIVIGDWDEKNPRLDGKYPFDKMFYLPINERCFSGKSLVFSMQGDARILNTLYQMRIDMGMLDLAPPVVTVGSDKAGANIFVPGMNIAFADENVSMNPLRVATPQAFSSADNLIEKVEASLSETSQDPTQQGQQSDKTSTAYEISRIEQNAATVLGLFMTMRVKQVIDFGELARGDVLQYCTLADLTKISGTDVGYKTFVSHSDGKSTKVIFDGNMPETMTEEEKLNASYQLLDQEKKLGITLYVSNPKLVRDLKYIQVIDADVVRPRSKDFERVAFNELYDRAIQNPTVDLKALGKQLFKMEPVTAKNPDQFMSAQQSAAQATPPTGDNGATPAPKQFLPPTAKPAPLPQR